MIGSGAEVVGEGGFTPSRYTMAGSPLDRMSDQLLEDMKSLAAG